MSTLPNQINAQKSDLAIFGTWFAIVVGSIAWIPGIIIGVIIEKTLGIVVETPFTLGILIGTVIASLVGIKKRHSLWNQYRQKIIGEHFDEHYVDKIKECKELEKKLPTQQEELKQTARAQLSHPMTAGQALLAMHRQAKQAAKTEGLWSMLLTLGTILGAGKESWQKHRAAKKDFSQPKSNPPQPQKTNPEPPTLPNHPEKLRISPDQPQTPVETFPPTIIDDTSAFEEAIATEEAKKAERRRAD